MKLDKLIVAILAGILLAACAPAASPILPTETATAMLPFIQLLDTATLPPVPPTDTVEAPLTTPVSLEGFPNSVLAGENERYGVYLLDQGSPDAPPKPSEIVIYDKSRKQAFKMDGTFLLIVDGTIVSDDGQGRYVLFSVGTYVVREAIVVSLVDKKQAVAEFCIDASPNGGTLFWGDYVLYNNCHTFQNRPWGGGDATGVAAVNLKTGDITELASPDLTHQYNVDKIAGNTLQYVETSVDREADWSIPANQKMRPLTFDLSSLK